MYEKFFVGGERLGGDYTILKKMQTTMRVWATPFTYISLREFDSLNHISFFSIFLFGLWSTQQEGGGIRSLNIFFS
jgi:hypothetical protein